MKELENFIAKAFCYEDLTNWDDRTVVALFQLCRTMKSEVNYDRRFNELITDIETQMAGSVDCCQQDCNDHCNTDWFNINEWEQNKDD